MSARPSRTPNEVALQELHVRLKEIDLAIRLLEKIERSRANRPTLAVVEQILSGGSEMSPLIAPDFSI
jgi:hypothetical protein